MASNCWTLNIVWAIDGHHYLYVSFFLDISWVKTKTTTLRLEMVVMRGQCWLVNILVTNPQEELNQVKTSFLSKWKLAQLQQQKGSKQDAASVRFQGLLLDLDRPNPTNTQMFSIVVLFLYKQDSLNVHVKSLHPNYYVFHIQSGTFQEIWRGNVLNTLKKWASIPL